MKGWKFPPRVAAFFDKRAMLKRFPDVVIRPPFYIEFGCNVIFQGAAYVGPHAYWSAKGGIRIGDNVILGPGTVLWSYNHDYKSAESIPYGGEDILEEIVIEDNVWIGLNATILPGVRIAEGAVIGAGSVVTTDIPKCAVAAGNPAKVINYRDMPSYDKLKSEGRFYLKIKEASGRGKK